MFQSRRFLEIDQSETIVVCGGQVSVHLAPQTILVLDWSISKNLLL
jgi:hypothetical protein